MAYPPLPFTFSVSHISKPGDAVASVLTSLKRLKANVIGVALNEVREDTSDHYYYYGYYGKYYSKYYKQPKE